MGDCSRCGKTFGDPNGSWTIHDDPRDCVWNLQSEVKRQAKRIAELEEFITNHSHGGCLHMDGTSFYSMKGIVGRGLNIFDAMKQAGGGE